MDINVQPVDNGWLVVNRTDNHRRVFIDREEMMKYLDEIIPTTGVENEFIDALDDEDDNQKIHSSDIKDLYNTLFKQHLDK